MCSCGHHHHHHGHDADEVFVSWGRETVRKFGEDELSAMLSKLDGGEYGVVLRAKGIVPCTDGGWIHFDYTPGEQNIRKGPADYTGRLCVIGSKLVDEAGEPVRRRLIGGTKWPFRFTCLPVSLKAAKRPSSPAFCRIPDSRATSTLIIQCEEGETEYEPDMLKKTHSVVECIEDEDEYNGDTLRAFVRKHHRTA